MDAFWAAPPVSRWILSTSVPSSLRVVHGRDFDANRVGLWQLWQPCNRYSSMEGYLIAVGLFSTCHGSSSFLCQKYGDLVPRSFWQVLTSAYCLTPIFVSSHWDPWSIKLLHELVWTYSSGLEKASGRFSQPGDFFVYIIFICLIILVC